MSTPSGKPADAGPSRKERLRFKEEQKLVEERRRTWRRRFRRGARVGLVVLIVGGGVAGLVAWLGFHGDLPPTSIANHVEMNPPGHILTEPMPRSIQKHMLEHADGIHGGPKGVIIQYNCKKFSCPGDLVEQLTRVAQGYPTFVYLAPNPTMDARIALTREGAILVLDQYDAEKIHRFINQ